MGYVFNDSLIIYETSYEISITDRSGSRSSGNVADYADEEMVAHLSGI